MYSYKDRCTANVERNLQENSKDYVNFKCIVFFSFFFLDIAAVDLKKIIFLISYTCIQILSTIDLLQFSCIHYLYTLTGLFSAFLFNLKIVCLTLPADMWSLQVMSLCV